MSRQEIRGVWIANRPHSQVLTSKNNIIQALDFLQKMGFNAIFPVVWNRGYTLFPSQVMVANGFPKIDPFFAGINFDPLQEMVNQAQARKMAVIPWFEYGFAASPVVDGGHILQQNPEWAALDKTGQKVRHGGLTWMNSLDLDVQQFMLDLILEVVQNYAVDGIQGDDRLPALPVTGGYNQNIQKRFYAEFGTVPSKNEKSEQWIQWRANILTEFLRKIYSQVKGINPNLIISIAPAVYPFCLDNLLQDSQAWVKDGILDFIHPQIYRESSTKYEKEIKKIKNDFTSLTQRAKFVPGIAFKANQICLSEADILQCISLNRNSGFQGQVFFFYEGLRKNQSAMAIALQTHGGYNNSADLPPPFKTF